MAGNTANMLKAAIPYEVSWDDVGVQVLHTTVSQASLPKLLNMSLVGLGEVEDIESNLVRSSRTKQQPHEVTESKAISDGLINRKETSDMNTNKETDFRLNPKAAEFDPVPSDGDATGTSINTLDKRLICSDHEINDVSAQFINECNAENDSVNQVDKDSGLMPPKLVLQKGIRHCSSIV